MPLAITNTVHICKLVEFCRNIKYLTIIC